MKQTINQVQKQSLALTPNLQNQIKLLSLSGEEIRSQLNLLIDQFFLKEYQDKAFHYFKDTILIDRYNKSLSKSINYPKREVKITEEESLRQSLLNQLSEINLKKHEYLIGEYLLIA